MTIQDRINQVLNDLPRYTFHGVIVTGALIAVMIVTVAMQPPKVIVVWPDDVTPNDVLVEIRKVAATVDSMEKRQIIHTQIAHPEEHK